MELTVARWTQRAVVPGEAEAWRARLDGLVRGPLRARIDAAADPGELVLVPRVHLRLRLPAGVDDATIADAWVEGLLRDLGTRPTVRFPDRPTAELAALTAGITGEEPWWAAQVLQDRLPVVILRAWLDDEPIRVPAAIVALAEGRPARLARLFSGQDAAALLAAMEQVWGASERVLQAPAFVLRPPDGVLHPAHLALLHAAEERLAWPQRDVSPGLAVEDVAPVARLEPDPATLVAPIAPVDPSLPEPSRVERAAADPTEVSPVPTPLQADPRAVPLSAEARPADTIEGAGSARVPEGGDRPAPPAPQLARWPLSMGGLLFLLRPLLRHPWLRAAPWPTWPGRLAGLADALLTRVLVGVPERERELILDVHADLIDAFTGGAGLVAEVEGADAVLDQLLDELPELRPIPASAAWVARARPAPRDEPLLALLVRPARLHLSRTHADLFLPLDTVDVELRRAGYDLDPGWLPGLRRVIRFHYEER